MKKSGFTMAELVITLSIIGIAAALIAPALSKLVPDKDKANIIQANLLLNEAIEDVFNDSNLYSVTTTQNDAGMGVNYTNNQGRDCWGGLSCINNRDDVIDKLNESLDINNHIRVNGGEWWDIQQVQDAASVDDDYYTVKICFNDEDGDVYSDNERNPHCYRFAINESGGILPDDSLTKAFFENPTSLNDRKADLERARAIEAQQN